MLLNVEIRQFGHFNIELIAKRFLLQLIFFIVLPVSPFSVFLSVISLQLGKTSHPQTLDFLPTLAGLTVFSRKEGKNPQAKHFTRPLPSHC